MAKASIPIGEVGFVFIKKFGSAGYFNGKVIKVLTNGKQLCEFCDNTRHSYTLHQLEVYSKMKIAGGLLAIVILRVVTLAMSTAAVMRTWVMILMGMMISLSLMIQELLALYSWLKPMLLQLHWHHGISLWAN